MSARPRPRRSLPAASGASRSTSGTRPASPTSRSATPAATPRARPTRRSAAAGPARRGGRGHVRPAEVSYGELVDRFWSLHDPTQVNRQGWDVGTQYRSAIFTHSPEQAETAAESKARAQARFGQPIATEIVPASTFWPAEEYHQQYLVKNGRATCRI